MPPLKFPPSVEIKRVLAAAQRAGIEIASIEIHPRKIIIIRRADDSTSKLSDYDLWKMSEQQDSSRVRHSEGSSDALADKSKR